MTGPHPGATTPPPAPRRRPRHHDPAPGATGRQAGTTKPPPNCPAGVVLCSDDARGHVGWPPGRDPFRTSLSRWRPVARPHSSALGGRWLWCVHHTSWEHPGARWASGCVDVELPGVEPGSRDPEALGSTCVGSGSSRARCSGARQHPCPLPPFGVPLGPAVMSSGWSLVMSIRPSYEASEADRRRCLGCECHLLIGSCVFPRVINEVAWASSARSHGNGLITIETVSAPGRWRIVAVELSTREVRAQRRRPRKVPPRVPGAALYRSS